MRHKKRNKLVFIRNVLLASTAFLFVVLPIGKIMNLDSVLPFMGEKVEAAENWETVQYSVYGNYKVPIDNLYEYRVKETYGRSIDIKYVDNNNYMQPFYQGVPAYGSYVLPQGYLYYFVSTVGQSSATVAIERRLLNSPPTMPTLSALSGPFASGSKVKVSWGASTDPEGTSLTYQLEASYNNGSSWSQLTNTSNLSYDYTVPSGQSKVMFRVRAYDGISYSNYTQSATNEIHVPPYYYYDKYTSQPTYQDIVGNTTLYYYGDTMYHYYQDTASGYTDYTKDANGRYELSGWRIAGNDGRNWGIYTKLSDYKLQKISHSERVCDNGCYSAYIYIYTLESTMVGNLIQSNIKLDSTYPINGEKDGYWWVRKSMIDSTPPTGTLTASPTAWTNGSVTITAYGSDAESGMKRIKKPDGTYATSASATYSITANGTYTFVFEDNAGNTLSKNITVSNIDKTRPVITFTPEEQKSSFTDIEVQLKITDQDGSGYKQYRSSWSLEETYPTTGWSDWATESKPLLVQNKSGKWVLHVEAKDNAGNLTYETRKFYEKLAISGGPSINLNVTPAPTGVWSNQALSAYILESGDAELLANANKTYEVTNSSTTPNSFTKIVPSDKKITLNLVGENFVHVQYVLDDGTKVTSTSGPYLIDTSSVGSFTMKLTNANGVEVTSWSKDALKLVLSNPFTTSVSGYVKQYRIEGFHTEWQTYREGMAINAEGEHRIFGRILNGASVVSEQLFVVARIDKNKPDIESLKLVRNTNGTYDVLLKAQDELSGIGEAKLADGSLLTSRSGYFEKNGLTTKPTSVTIADRAGNQMASVTFATEPAIAFDAPYTQNLSVYKNDAVANISNATHYILGSNVYACATSPCKVTISSNAMLTAVKMDGVKESRNIVNLTNIDKRTYVLSLSGKRNAVRSTQIDFRWNLPLTNATLKCEEGGSVHTYNLSGNSYELANTADTVRCFLTSIYKGQTLASSTIVVYANAGKAGGNWNGVPTNTANTNVYKEETRLGYGYFINGKVDNHKNNPLPIPQNEITRD